jgi:hypothetical protein
MQHSEMVRITAGVVFFLLVSLLLWRRRSRR